MNYLRTLARNNRAQLLRNKSTTALCIAQLRRRGLTRGHLVECFKYTLTMQPRTDIDHWSLMIICRCTAASPASAACQFASATSDDLPIRRPAPSYRTDRPSAARLFAVLATRLAGKMVSKWSLFRVEWNGRRLLVNAHRRATRRSCRAVWIEPAARRVGRLI